MRDIYEKCQVVQINPRYKVDSNGKPSKVLITAKMAVRDSNGSMQYASLNCVGNDMEQAEAQCRKYVESWLSVSVEQMR